VGPGRGGEIDNTIAQNTKILIEKSNIPSKTKSNIKNIYSDSSRLYGLPKVHKLNILLRPMLVPYSPRQLIPLPSTNTIRKSESHITNSTDFIQKNKKNPTTSYIDLLVSFDVSLFTQVSFPIKDTLNIIKASLEIFSYLIPLRALTA